MTLTHSSDLELAPGITPATLTSMSLSIARSMSRLCPWEIPERAETAWSEMAEFVVTSYPAADPATPDTAFLHSLRLRGVQAVYRNLRADRHHRGLRQDEYGIA